MEKQKGQIVGYARVSTAEQNEQRQIVALKQAGAEKIFLDKLSGKDTNRPQLKSMLDYVREGDTLIISEYSRLARSTKDLLEIIDTLKNKGVTVISQKENFDTSTPQGELVLTVMAGIATFERKLMLQRQKEGIELAKQAGKYKGRKSADKPADWAELKALYQSRKITATELAKRANVSRPIIYKWLKENTED